MVHSTRYTVDMCWFLLTYWRSLALTVNFVVNVWINFCVNWYVMICNMWACNHQVNSLPSLQALLLVFAVRPTLCYKLLITVLLFAECKIIISTWRLSWINDRELVLSEASSSQDLLPFEPVKSAAHNGSSWKRTSSKTVLVTTFKQWMRLAEQ